MLARRRNPTASKFSDAAIGGLLSSLGGGVAYAMHWGASYAPVGNVGQTLILAGAGTATSIGVAMLADERAANGIMGGTIALTLGRIHAQWLLGKMVKKKTAENGNAVPNGEASGLYGRRGAGALPMTVNPHRQAYAGGAGQVAAFTGPLPGGAGVVVPRGSVGAAGPLHITHEAGAMMDPAGRIQPAPATTSARMGFAGGESFKQPEHTPGMEAGTSRYVPGGVRWFGPRSWAYDAGKVFRSAHDVRR
jgi:hypothetical protein